MLGIVYVGIGLMKIDNIKMSEILLANTMSGVEFYPQYISTFSFEYIPIFVFKFCSQQIYTNIFVVQAFIFFFKNVNRIKWYLKEVTNIYLNSIIFFNSYMYIRNTFYLYVYYD